MTIIYALIEFFLNVAQPRIKIDALTTIIAILISRSGLIIGETA